MTKTETEILLRYMMTMYPNVRMTEQQFEYSVKIWAAEFEKYSKEMVAEAFKVARSESPDWMPSVPKIQKAIDGITSSKRTKSKEQEYMDSHCGKTPEEWAQMESWEQSQEGRDKIRRFQEEFARLINAKLNGERE